MQKFLLEHYGGFTDDWNLFSFINDPKPSNCFGEKCVCICDDIATGFQNQAAECTENGICFNVPNLKNEVNIPLEKTLNEIFIKKENGEILISDKIIDSGESARIIQEANVVQQEEESFISNAWNSIKSIFGGGKPKIPDGTAVTGVKGANPGEISGDIGT